MAVPQEFVVIVAIPIGSIAVPFWDCLIGYRILVMNPKRNYFGPMGKANAVSH